MKIALIGYGKMGRAIEKEAIERGDEVVVKIDHDNTADFTQENLEKADVAIEFTSPDSAYDNIHKLLSWGIPTVSGSTGWTDKLFEIEKYCLQQHGSFLYSSNFSLGVNLFFKLNTYLAKLMNNYPQYEIKVTETHHTEKKDAPSGTSITLADQIIQANRIKDSWTTEKDAPENELLIKSYREPDVPGTHSIHYKDDIDEIMIEHRAFSRRGFAMGALTAAHYINLRKGVFTMDDVFFSDMPED